MKIFVLAGAVLFLSETTALAETDVAADGSECAQWTPGAPCWRKPWRRPHLVLSLEGGVTGQVEGGPFGFRSGTGSATTLGPQWGVRAGVDFFRWLGVEARYVGIYNSGNASVSQGGGVGFLTTGIEGVVRFTLPTPYLRPYVAGGVGYYDSHLLGSAAAKAVSTLNSNDSVGFPVGVGIEVPLAWQFSLCAEATYRFLLNESFSTSTTRDIDGADFTTFSAVAKWRL